MPAAAERKIKSQGGAVRHRTIHRGDKTFTVAVTRKEGPQGGRTVVWERKKR